jgi:hypothetical protein
LIITPEIDLAAVFTVELLPDEQSVLVVRKAIGPSVAVGVLVYAADFAVFVIDSAI